jgi:hypothetical protein
VAFAHGQPAECEIDGKELSETIDTLDPKTRLKLGLAKLIHINIKLLNTAIDANILKESVASLNPKLAVCDVQFLQLYFALDAQCQTSNTCIAQVIMTDVQYHNLAEF